MSDFVTILTHNNIPLTKVWVLGPEGKPQKKSFPPTAHFDVSTAEVKDLESLYGVLTDLQISFNREIIRGQLIPGRENLHITRTKKARAGEQANFRDIPHAWVLVDVDWRKDLFKADYSTEKGCLDVVNYALAKMPFELRSAGCVWQFSASAGFEPGIRLHLWFWLDRPMNSRELRLWAENTNEEAGEGLIDCALMEPIQQHFCVPPLLEGLEDPIAVRLGILPGNTAVIPRMTEKRSGYKRHLIALKDPKVTKIHDYVRDACASYFCSHGPEASSAEFFIELRDAVDEAQNTMDREDYTDSKLEEEIESGRVFARDKATAFETLLRDTSGAIKPVDSNARALLMGSPAWHGILVKNKRTGKAEFAGAPPWSEDTGVVKESDAGLLGDWYHTNFGVGFKNSTCWEAIQDIAARTLYDPVEEDLGRLVWDGTRRIDTWLSVACSASNGQIREALGEEAEGEYLKRVGRMVLISGVARALTEGESKVDTIMVLEGKQGKQKSSMLHILGGEYYAAHNDGSANERDVLAKFHSGAWILEFKELVSLGRGVDRVKAMLDSSSDEFRRAYRRDEETYVRRCIAIATTNREAYLEDETGNRRFWPVQVGDIDLKLLSAMRDQLWAEAVVAWRAGEPWWVEAEDPLFCEAQEGAFKHDSWEEGIKRALENGAVSHAGGKPIMISPGCDFVTIADILLCVFGDLRQSKTDQIRVAAVLKKLGWNRITSWSGDTRGQRGWGRTAPAANITPTPAKIAVEQIKEKRRIFKRMN